MYYLINYYEFSNSKIDLLFIVNFKIWILNFSYSYIYCQIFFWAKVSSLNYFILQKNILKLL